MVYKTIVLDSSSGIICDQVKAQMWKMQVKEKKRLTTKSINKDIH